MKAEVPLAEALGPAALLERLALIEGDLQGGRPDRQARHAAGPHARAGHRLRVLTGLRFTPRRPGRGSQDPAAGAARGCSMEGMSIAPEEVEAPAADAVLFRSSPVRDVRRRLPGARWSPTWPSRRWWRCCWAAPDDPWWLTLLQAAVIGALVAGALRLISPASSLTTWVRVSRAAWSWPPRAATRCCWPGRTSPHVAVRRAGAAHRAGRHPGRPGPGASGARTRARAGPTMTETAAGTAFTADLTQVWPGPARSAPRAGPPHAGLSRRRRRRPEVRRRSRRRRSHRRRSRRRRRRSRRRRVAAAAEVAAPASWKPSW